MNSYYITFPFSRDPKCEGILMVDRIEFTIIDGVFHYPGIPDPLPVGDITIHFNNSPVPLLEADLFPLLQGDGSITNMRAFRSENKRVYDTDIICDQILDAGTELKSGFVEGDGWEIK